jgi:hypothetical protein
LWPAEIAVRRQKFDHLFEVTDKKNGGNMCAVAFPRRLLLTHT